MRAKFFSNNLFVTSVVIDVGALQRRILPVPVHGYILRLRTERLSEDNAILQDIQEYLGYKCELPTDALCKQPTSATPNIRYGTRQSCCNRGDIPKEDATPRDMHRQAKAGIAEFVRKCSTRQGCYDRGPSFPQTRGNS